MFRKSRQTIKRKENSKVTTIVKLEPLVERCKLRHQKERQTSKQANASRRIQVRERATTLGERERENETTRP